MTDKKADALYGIVTRAQAGIYHVWHDGRLIECSLRKKIKQELTREYKGQKKPIFTDPVAVGDEVMITAAEGGSGAIEAIMPRRSKLFRRAAGPMPLEQVLVANADQLVIVLSTKMPNFKIRLLDRFLIVAEAGKLEPIICINKMDLLGDEEIDNLRQKTQVYENLGYKTIYTSALKKEGLETFADLMKGKLSALAGPSGTGKTTILNVIQPGLQLRVSEVSIKKQKGKHTTSSVQLHPLDFGGYVVDTPGIRELGLWEVWQEEMELYFPEIRPLIGSCKFSNCSHIHEPECAVKKAVTQGKINEARYKSYVRLRLGTSRNEFEEAEE